MTTNSIDQIWLDDKLNRKAEALHLTRFLENLYKDKTTSKEPNTFVLNINAEWGFGKTFFLEKWKEQLLHHGYKVASFDAWQTDFSNEPLLSFVAEISNYLEEISDLKSKKQLKAFKESIQRIGISMAPLLMEIAVKKATGMHFDDIKENLKTNEEADQQKITDDISKNLGQLTKIATSTALNEFNQKKKGIEHFKRCLEDLIKHLESKKNTQLPIFVFVDELDRCRPSYAIELLESIKHLFGIDGLYFVIATDSEQLSHAIRSVYGEGFDSRKYLKRFFDLEYIFPESNNTNYSQFLFSSTSIDSKLYIPKSMCNGSIPIVFGIISTYFRLTPRDQKQIFELIKVSCLTYDKADKLHLIFLMLLACIKHISSKEDFTILMDNFSEQKLHAFLEQLLKTKKTSDNIPIFQTGSTDQRTTEIHLNEIFKLYANLLNYKIPDLYKKMDNESKNLKREVYSELLNNAQHRINENPHEFVSYEHYISQAGRFSQ